MAIEGRFYHFEIVQRRQTGIVVEGRILRLARASFISSESGLPRIASMMPRSRSVLRARGTGLVAEPESSLALLGFSMPQRRNLVLPES